MRLDGVIFDLDGTLADTLPICFVAFRRAMEEFSGRQYTDEEIMGCFGPSEEGIIQRLVPDRWEDCLCTYLEAYEREHRRTARLFPGIETALARLRERGVALAIVTGRGPKTVAITLRQFDLSHRFDVVETGVPEGANKPSGIQRVLARWGASPDRVAYVGDTASDVEDAKIAGVIPLGAAWDPRSNAESLHRGGPQETFPSVERFIHWIDTTVESILGAHESEERPPPTGTDRHRGDLDDP
jgi:phosphoglycolate phosphatase-like HAD superfamily hydrolase